jgi:hypothetical protein
MALPQGPLSAGTRISLPVEVEVVRDDGMYVAVRIPNGFGGFQDWLLPRPVLDPGEVLGG